LHVPDRGLAPSKLQMTRHQPRPQPAYSGFEFKM
jgi:hypothetical protein